MLSEELADEKGIMRLSSLVMRREEADVGAERTKSKPEEKMSTRLKSVYAFM